MEKLYMNADSGTSLAISSQKAMLMSIHMEIRNTIERVFLLVIHTLRYHNTI
jgi:hypothetical protein